jgi:hypothetical protein
VLVAAGAIAGGINASIRPAPASAMTSRFIVRSSR